MNNLRTRVERLEARKSPRDWRQASRDALLAFQLAHADNMPTRDGWQAVPKVEGGRLVAARWCRDIGFRDGVPPAGLSAAERAAWHFLQEYEPMTPREFAAFEAEVQRRAEGCNT